MRFTDWGRKKNNHSTTVNRKCFPHLPSVNGPTDNVASKHGPGGPFASHDNRRSFAGLSRNGRDQRVRRTFDGFSTFRHRLHFRHIRARRFPKKKGDKWEKEIRSSTSLKKLISVPRNSPNVTAIGGDQRKVREGICMEWQKNLRYVQFSGALAKREQSL